MRVSRLLSPVTVLGPGRRLALWVQGCTLACPGCASTDTWDPRGGREVAVEDLAAEVVEVVTSQGLTGLTITGGEPFQQADDLVDLLAVLAQVAPEIDVLAFTGYEPSVARRLSPQLWARCDVVVAGRYRRERPAGPALIASDNQELVVNTQRGRRRLAELSPSSPRLQVAASDRDLYLVGLPAAGDLDRLATSLRDRGVEFEHTTWTA